MVGDKVNGVLYATKEDGVKLYRFAVPNKMDSKTGEWIPPKKKIMQEQTGILYDAAVDVENSNFTYVETDTPVDSDTSDDPKPEPVDPDALTLDDTLDMLNQMGVDTDDK